MEGKTITVTVQQLDEPKTTQSGTPQRGVKTAEMGWVQVRGKAIAFLAVGGRIEITEPTEFKNKKYAELRAMAGPARSAEIAPATGKSTPGYGSPAIKIADYLAAIKDFHTVAEMIEPDVHSSDGSALLADRSQARAAILNTFSIALTNGKIDLGEPECEPGLDDLPPWER